MMDKRYLYRGFHPNENGNTTITFNGKKIKGEWRYWNKFGRLVDPNTLKEKPYYSKCENYDFPVYESAMLILIEETIGQFVKTDKNGKNIFEGDWVSYTNNQKGVYEIGKKMEGVIAYEEDGCYWYSKNNFQHHNDWAYAEDLKVIGNQWEYAQ